MWLQVYLSAAFIGFALSEGDDTPRRTLQVPFVADAVGNSLPPPSELPAKVGSPSNLLTPDRYEFYTFDESGELVKRLMTLEEIQAIVAAGEGNDGHMVTFAQDEKPTIAFNFSQPPFTKVHSVVTNVQNVLKSQIEAQKNNPPKPVSFDTPDVSNSWSMILPSIFGNTGVDIVPDKLPNAFGTAETETIDVGIKPVINIQNSDTNALSKEEADDNLESLKNNAPEIDSIDETTEDSSAQSTPKPAPTTDSTTSTKPKTTTTTTTTTKPNPTTTTTKKTSTSTTTMVNTDKPYTTSKPIQVAEPSKSSYNQTFEMISSSNLNQPTIDQETISKNPEGSHKNSHMSPVNTPTTENSYIEITKPKSTSTPSTTLKIPTKIRITTTKYPMTTISTISTVIESMTEHNEPHLTVTTYRPSSSVYFSSSENPNDSVTNADLDVINKSNGTTLTTQSVSPSTAHITTDVGSSANNEESGNNKFIDQIRLDNFKSPDSLHQDLNLTFDVAQSISQIASDLGNNFDTQHENEHLDSDEKGNGDLQIPNNPIDKPKDAQLNSTFIKISTIHPDSSKDNQTVIHIISTTSSTTEQNHQTISRTEILKDNIESTDRITSIDPVIDLSDSMSDLLSQVVDQEHHNVIKTTTVNDLTEPTTDSPLNRNDDMDIITTTLEPKDILKNQLNDKETSEISKDTIQETQKNKDILKINTTDLTKKTIQATSIHSSILSKEQNESNKINTTDFKPIDKMDTEKLSTTKIEPETSSTATAEVKHVLIKNVLSSINNTSNIEIKMTLKDQEIAEISNENSNSKILVTENANQTGINSNNYSQLVSTTPEITTKDSLTSEEPQIGETNATSTSKNDSQSKYVSDQSHQVNLLQKPQKIGDSKKKIHKVNIDEKEYTENANNNSWKLVSTVPPPKNNDIPSENQKPDSIKNQLPEFANDPSKEINLDSSRENQGLEVTIKNLGEDVYQFTDLCNELAFRYWNAAVEHLDKKRSFVLSPYSITSMLAMMFMGARGATSGEMNDILKLDDMVTFNPHFTLKNISDSIETSPETGVAVSAFVRELYSDRNRGKLLTFYKERAQHFYNGHVEEINFKLVNDIIRRRTNLLVKRDTWGKISEYIKTNNIAMKPPLAAFSANVFETDCTGSSVDGRDGEMYFVVSPSVRQRRLVPVPAVVYRAGFLAGYDPVLDATAAALGTASSTISTVLLMPGQQGNVVHADDLERLEKRLLDSIPTAPEWYRLLRALLPRPGLELQIPRFSHRSVFNVSSTLRGMGLKDIFDPKNADLGGLNGPSKDLYLSDMIQTSTFVTCGEGIVGEQHHIEEYPELSDEGRRRRTLRWTSGWDEPRDYQRAFHDPHDVGAALLPLHLRPRQARLPSRSAPPQPARLKFDRPFLYFVRHNPSGMILYVGRYNPRLLP